MGKRKETKRKEVGQRFKKWELQQQILYYMLEGFKLQILVLRNLAIKRKIIMLRQFVRVPEHYPFLSYWGQYCKSFGENNEILKTCFLSSVFLKYLCNMY